MKILNNKRKIHILIIFLIILFLEIFVFNMNSYRLIFSDCEEATYTSEDMIFTNLAYQAETDEFIVTSDRFYIEIFNIDQEIGTIKLDIENITALANSTENDNPIWTTEYRLYYTDQTSKEYKDLPYKTYVNTIENSKYLTCYLSGPSDKITIEVTAPINNIYKINEIVINEKVPFNFNITRFIVLLFTTLFIYAIFNFNVFKIPYDKKHPIHKVVIFNIVILFICILALTTISSGTQHIEPEDADVKYSYNKDFVDALLDGQVNLKTTPPEELKQLENPYDTTARQDIRYLWDAAYYDGDYYVYFGILPALILFIPYKLITGTYLDLNIGVLIFSALATIFSVKLLLILIKRYFKNMSFRMVLLSIITLMFSTFLIWLNGRAETYELVIAAGFYFIMQGLYLFFKSIEKEQINYIYLTLSTLSMALSVACRPTMLLASVIILPVLLKLFIQIIKDKNKIGVLKYVLAVILPYMVVGISLMVYNYIRFDNILEFGANYQLTINDIGKLEHRAMVIPMGIYSYLLKPIVYIPVFPFILVNGDITTFYGFYFVENMAGGLFNYAPICYIIFLIYKFKKYLKENKELAMYILLMIILGIVLCIVNITMGGNVQRYVVDFAWCFILPSILLVLLMFENIKQDSIKQIITKIMLVLTIYIVIVNILAGIQSSDNRLKLVAFDKYFNIRYSICFWE